METKTRAEHLAWCKTRAMNEYAFSGKPDSAIASVVSDMCKHPETALTAPVIGQLGIGLIMCGSMNTEHDVRKFIDGIA